MFLSVKRSRIFSEFTPEEQQRYFSLTEKKVLPHVDNIYYSVFIRDDSGDPDRAPEGLRQFLIDLHEAKVEKLQSYSEEVTRYGLSVCATGFSIYGFHLSCNENFDIFVSSYLPNDETSRVHVQIRSRMLLLEGAEAALEASFAKVEEILHSYRLLVDRVQENRMDFANHTNLIQNPDRMLHDSYIQDHLCTAFRTVHKVGKFGRLLDWEYIGLGNRKSNNVFFRMYNKSQEVIREHYKSFFFDYWRDHGLISEYDHYCYMKAFELQSYKTGLLVGRIFWCLEHGKDPQLKAQLRELYQSCNIRSDNNDQIERELDGVLPPVTLIMNCEFECKRKFFVTISAYLDAFRFIPKKAKTIGPYEVGEPEWEPLLRLYKLLACRPNIHAYLTNDLVSFRDKEDDDMPMVDWWERIHRVRVSPDSDWRGWGDVYRKYERKTDELRSRNRAINAIAQLCMVHRDSLEEVTATEAFQDLITLTNDNDWYGFMPNQETGEVPDLSVPRFRDIWQRKARQYKGIIGKEESEDPET